MSETYDIPDDTDIPKIKTNTEEPFTKPEKKHLFLTYNSDEWKSKSDIDGIVNAINSLFGTEVQVTIMPSDFDLLSKDDLRGLIDE